MQNGPARTRSSKIVGEKGGRDVAIAVSPWTSDHRAVLSTFAVRPAPMPSMIAVNARLQTVGDRMTVAYNAPESEGNEIAIVRAGRDPASSFILLRASAICSLVRNQSCSMSEGADEISEILVSLSRNISFL